MPADVHGGEPRELGYLSQALVGGKRIGDSVVYCEGGEAAGTRDSPVMGLDLGKWSCPTSVPEAPASCLHLAWGSRSHQQSDLTSQSICSFCLKMRLSLG